MLSYDPFDGFHFLIEYCDLFLYLFMFLGVLPPPLPVDPATCPIVPGQEMTIEISKGRSGLGLSIVGGKDTPLVSFC